jgi:hypothetical protein
MRAKKRPAKRMSGGSNGVVAAAVAICAVVAIASLPGVLKIASAAGGTRVVAITDPVLSMRAYSLTIPADWLFDGAVIPGTSCNDGPFPVFRMMSPDGLIGIKQLPRMDWTWADNGGRPLKSGEDCLPFNKDMPAAEVLKYMIGVLQVEYVREEPTTDLAQAQKNAAAQSGGMFVVTVDKARAVVRYRINKIVIEDKLSMFVSCRYFKSIGQHSCSASLSRAWAPEASYNDEIYKPIVRTFAVDQQWNAVRTQIYIQKINDMSEASMRAIRQMGDEAMRRSKAQFNAFNQAQAMRQHQHEQFLASMQRGTDMSMARANESINARHQAADDWCDYSLDLQKRLDPNTGEITKDSSAYSYSWVNEQGKRIQTNDVNANPNGNGTGNWTLQENVR